MNILAVSHQQEVRYKGMEEELCSPTLVSTMELASLSLEREVLNSLSITKSGQADGIAYWFALRQGLRTAVHVTTAVRLERCECEVLNDCFRCDISMKR